MWRPQLVHDQLDNNLQHVKFRGHTQMCVSLCRGCVLLGQSVVVQLSTPLRETLLVRTSIIPFISEAAAQ
jgi:hypothetical protein